MMESSGEACESDPIARMLSRKAGRDHDNRTNERKRKTWWGWGDRAESSLDGALVLRPFRPASSSAHAGPRIPCAASRRSIKRAEASAMAAPSSGAMMRTDAGQRCGKRFKAPLIGREISCVNAESATYIDR